LNPSLAQRIGFAINQNKNAAEICGVFSVRRVSRS
jgi:hypothetical protein